jgi:hypothetical protein
MSENRSRSKGARTELFVARELNRLGFKATKISRMYRPGCDLNMTVAGRMLEIEVKSRTDGFRELYSWLDQRDLLVLKADRREPLLVMRLALAAEIIKE